jgi:putative nucleotidyltransferase with HDIG domain
MTSPVGFLNALAQTLSTMMLYPREHPTWQRAVDASFAQLEELQHDNPNLQFSFIGADVIYGQAPLHDMKDWPWSDKLAVVGIQRLEFEPGVMREEYAEFLADVLARIVQSGSGGGAAPPMRRQSIKFGAVTVREEDDEGGDGGGAAPASGERGLPFGLDEEAGAVTWMYDQVATKDAVPLVEADAVVRSLTVAMKGSSAMIIPLLRLKASDPYNAIHSINVAVLTMALAEFLGLGNRDVHEFGMAALLHDLGMARVPRELLLKPIELTVEERTVIERHTTDGARIILSSDRRQELSACVAYEHHLRPDGSGYPARLFRRPTHYASRLVRVCSVYNALRIERAHRQPYPPGRALLFIDERAGREFEADIATSFTTMMRRLEPQITELDRDMRIRTPHAPMLAIPDDAIHH